MDYCNGFLTRSTDRRDINYRSFLNHVDDITINMIQARNTFKMVEKEHIEQIDMIKHGAKLCDLPDIQYPVFPRIQES